MKYDVAVAKLGSTLTIKSTSQYAAFAPVYRPRYMNIARANGNDYPQTSSPDSQAILVGTHHDRQVPHMRAHIEPDSRKTLHRQTESRSLQ